MPNANAFEERKRRTTEMTFSLAMTTHVDVKLSIERNSYGEVVIHDGNNKPIVTIY